MRLPKHQGFNEILVEAQKEGNYLGNASLVISLVKNNSLHYLVVSLQKQPMLVWLTGQRFFFFLVINSTAMCGGKRMKFWNMSAIFELFKNFKSEIDFTPKQWARFWGELLCGESCIYQRLESKKSVFVPTLLMAMVIFSLDLIEPTICVRWCSNKHWFVIRSIVRATRFGLSLRLLRHSLGVSLFIRLVIYRLSSSSSSPTKRV